MPPTDARAADGSDPRLDCGGRWRDTWGAIGNLVRTDLNPRPLADAEGRS
jgi:hypothetical protein